MSRAVSSGDISAQNTGISALRVNPGNFNVSVQGTFTATIFLQRSCDGGTTWFDMESYTIPAEKVGETGEHLHVRLFCKTGGYTSGTAACRLGQWQAY